MADDQRVANEESGDSIDQNLRQKTFSRKALLAAGWTAPVVLAVAVPLTAAHAATPHTDTHNDTHTDHHIRHG